jgi:Fur family ferric uptake transcriptional regulator
MIIIINQGASMNHPAAEEILTSWQESLHHHGYRMTRPRRLVMEIIASSPTALSPQEIYQISLQEDQSLGIASVYRTVEMLEKLNLVQQVHEPGGCHGIWPALEGHKHYLICRDCGRMEIIPGNENIDGYIRRVEDQTGYQVDDHWLQLFGHCGECEH